MFKYLVIFGCLLAIANVGVYGGLIAAAPAAVIASAPGWNAGWGGAGLAAGGWGNAGWGNAAGWNAGWNGAALKLG